MSEKSLDISQHSELNTSIISEPVVTAKKPKVRIINVDSFTPNTVSFRPKNKYSISFSRKKNN